MIHPIRFTLSVLVLSLITTTAQALEIVTRQDGNKACVLGTFEVGADFAPINPTNGYLYDTSTVMRFPGWQTLSAAAINNPSIPTIASWSPDEPGFPDGSSREITFDVPVAEISVFYASSVPVIIEALDATDAVLQSINLLANASFFDVWHPVTLTHGANEIVRLVVTGGPFATGIDDFEYCIITEVPPEEAISELINDVLELNIQAGISNALDSKLDNALAALDDANENNDGAAVNKLEAFINQVEAQRGNELTDAEADALIDAAQAIIDAIENGTGVVL